MTARSHAGLLTVEDAAKALSVTPGRVRQLLDEGRLKGQKYGPIWLIGRDELRRFAQLDRPHGRHLSKG